MSSGSLIHEFRLSCFAALRFSLRSLDMELFLVAKGSVFVELDEVLDTVIETSANGSFRAAPVGLWIALGAFRRERFFSGNGVSPQSPEPTGA
jgi:hypothetical protein